MYTAHNDPDRPWTGTELEQLHQLAEAGLPIQVIGLKLGRTTATITSQADQLGLAVAHVTRPADG
jgi:hypothetical protein